MTHVLRWPAVLAIAATLLSGCGTSGSPARAEFRCDPMPGAVAHRGGTEKALENTTKAFQSAGEAGIKVWELDVRFDVEGTPVVLHDDRVDRISPMTGSIATLDAGDRAIPTDDGQYVPTLREIYRLADQYDAYVLTEFKIAPTDTQWTSVIDDVDQTIGRSATTMMSFQKPIVREVRTRFPDVATGLLHGAGYLAPEQIQEYGDSYMQSAASISASRAKSWRDAGLKLYAWTVNKQADWERLSAMPVDAFITDKPIAYQQWATGRCA